MIAPTEYGEHFHSPFAESIASVPRGTILVFVGTDVWVGTYSDEAASSSASSFPG